MNQRIEGPEGAPFVVLSNSLLSDLSMWDPQMQALTDEFRVLRYDTRGHGKSPVTTPPYSMELLAEDLASIISDVGEPAHIVGLSLGGMVAQTLAISNPDLVSSLCLVATTCLKPSHGRRVWEERIQHVEEHGTVENLLPQILDRWVSMRFRREHPKDLERIIEMVRSTPPVGYVGCCHAIAGFDIRDRLAEISVPTLVVVGEEDSGTTLEDAELIQSGIRDARLTEVEHVRHLVNWEVREQFNEVLLGWLHQNSNQKDQVTDRFLRDLPRDFRFNQEPAHTFSPVVDETH